VEKAIMSKKKAAPGPSKRESAAKPTVSAKEKPKDQGQRAGNRVSWLDAKTHTPVIEKYARQLTSFLNTMADGVVEEREIKEQEERLAKLIEEIEPQLDDALHEKITHLLCELTAYDLMQMFYHMQQARPKTRLRL
jgi:hypothetical protein